MIHHPSVYSVKDLENLIHSRPDLRLWKNSGIYMGIIKEPGRGRQEKGTVVLFHGNAGSVLERLWYADALSGLGFRVILHEHPGYGARKGCLKERCLVGAGDETLKLALQRYGSPLFVMGESLGSGVAAAVISGSRADGAILIVPWDRLETVAKRHFPYLPMGLILREKYDSISNLSGFRGPLAVVVAENDEIIPPLCGKNLFDSFGGRKRLWISNGEGHNTWSDMADQAFWTEVMNFVSTKGE